MELEIPLINDLSKTFDNFNMNEHFDSEIIQMHNNFINNKIENYTDKQIYNYIKFINLTCMDVKYYKNIANYINKNNFEYFLELFDNYDIFTELFYLLSYESASCHPKFKYFKNIWLKNNFNKLFIYYDEFKPYLIYRNKLNEYYIIDDKVYGIYSLNNIIYDLDNIYLMENIKSEHIFMIVKYIFNIIYNNNVLSDYNFKILLTININLSINSFNFDLIKHLIEDYDGYLSPFNSGKIELRDDKFNIISDKPKIDYEPIIKEQIINIKFQGVKIPLEGGEIKILVSDTFIEKLVKYNRFDIVKYITEIGKLCLNNTLKSAIKYSNVEMMKYLIEKGADINYENLLRISSRNNCFEIVEYLIENGINVDKLGYNAIKDCYDLNIVKYIINKFKKFKATKLYKIVAKENIMVAKYLENNFIINEKLLLNNGSINIIKKYINCEYILDNKLLKYNSENECIEFFEYVIRHSNNNPIKCLNITDDNYYEFIDECIVYGYLKLLKFLINNVKHVIYYNMGTLIEFSKNEDDVIYFIENNYKKRDFIISFDEVIVNLIKKGYLQSIKCLEENLIKNIGCHYFFLTKSIEFENIEILKYLLSFEKVCVSSLLGKTLNVKNFEITKYLIDNINKYITYNYKKEISFIHTYYNEDKNIKIYGNIIKYLLEKGSKITYDVFETFCMCEDLEMVKFLLDKNEKPYTFPIGNLNTLLIKLLKYNKLESIKFFIENYNKFINFSDEHLLNSVNRKCIEGGYEIVKIMINYIDYFYKITTKYIDYLHKFIISAYNNNNFNIVVLLININKSYTYLLKDYIKNDESYVKINNYLIENGL